MATIYLPTPRGEIAKALDEHGRVRLSDIEEETERDREEFYQPLMEMVEEGDVAVFPVGDTVQVRDDS